MPQDYEYHIDGEFGQERTTQEIANRNINELKFPKGTFGF